MVEKGYRYGVFFAARNESELERRAFLCGQKRQRTRDPPLGSCTCRARAPVPIPVQNGARVSCKWRIVTIVAEQPNFDAQEARYTTKTTTPVATEGDEENKQNSEFSLVYFFSTFSQPIQVCIFQRSLRQRRDALKSLPGGGPPVGSTLFPPLGTCGAQVFPPCFGTGDLCGARVASIRLVHSPSLLLLVSATVSVF